MSCSKDYYEILGVRRNATENEIKEAYRRLVKLCHPDKCGNDNQRIYDLNEAFEILRHEDTRKKYDSINCINGNDVSGDIIKALFNIISKMVQKIVNEKRKKQTDETPDDDNKNPDTKVDIKLTIDVKLEDLYMKKVKKLVVNRKRNGVYEKKTLYISLVNYEEKYVFSGQGDEFGDDKNKKYGDVIVYLNILEHPHFVVDTLICKYDLWLEADINLYEYYYGKCFKYKHLDGEEREEIITRFNQKSLLHLVSGGGLPYYNKETDEEHNGDLYISFRLILKEFDDNELEKSEIREVLSKFL